MKWTRRYLQIGTFVGLGAAIGCGGPSTEDPPFPSVTDLPREDVVRLLGEPLSEVEAPFPRKFKGSCLDSATRALVYKVSKERTVVLYLGEEDTVICETNHLMFIER